jgi:putative addiction module component (TIGR02574 family)
MTTTVETLSTEARKLPLADRIALAEEILSTIDSMDPELNQHWLAEIKERVAAYRRGEITARDAEDVFAEYARK